MNDKIGDNGTKFDFLTGFILRCSAAIGIFIPEAQEKFEMFFGNLYKRTIIPEIKPMSCIRLY